MRLGSSACAEPHQEDHSRHCVTLPPPAEAHPAVGSRVNLVVPLAPATRAAFRVPCFRIVFFVGDPVATSFASSLAKPGGKWTGVSVVSPELSPKRLELLHQIRT
jgi:putative tryptophan/tyrosine transport system substrate-binding protein